MRRLLAAATLGSVLGLRLADTAAADAHDGRSAASFTREERRRLVTDRLRFHRGRRPRRGTVEVRLRSQDGQLLRFDRDGKAVTLTEGGVVVTANGGDVDVNTDGSGCRIEAFDTDVDGGTDRIDLGSCGVVEIVR